MSTISGRLLHHAINSMPDEVFHALMADITSRHDSAYFTQLLSAGTVPPELARYFTHAAPLPMVIDPFALLSGPPDVPEALGIDPEDVYAMLENYLDADCDDDDELMDELCGAASDSLPGAEPRPLFQTDPYFVPGGLLCTSSVKDTHSAAEQAGGPSESRAVKSVPVFSLLPGGEHAYAAIVGASTVVTGATREEAVVRARGYHGLPGWESPKGRCVGVVSVFEPTIAFIDAPRDPRMAGLPPPSLPTNWDVFIFVRRGIKNNG